MPLKTDQKDRERSVIANRLKHITILMIGSLLCATVLGMYVSGSEYLTVRNCIYGCAFVLSFGFLLVFYIDVNKENILSTRSSRLVLTLIPSICLFILHCGNIQIASCVMIVLLTLLSGCFNFTLSSLTLFMLYVYAVFFSEFTVLPSIGTVLFIFAVSLFARSVFTIKNSLYSIFTVTAFYAIVLFIECDFASEEILTVFHLLVLLFGIISLLGVRFVVMLLTKGLSQNRIITFSIPENVVSSTDDESSRPFGMSKESDRDLDKYNIENYVSREDYDKLEDRLVRVYKENDELIEKISELTDKKSVLSVADICKEEFMYQVRLKLDNPNLYEHSLLLAGFSAGAAAAIACDKELAYALGILHDASKILGPEYLEILSSKYCVPDYLIKPLNQMSFKQIDFPIMRETGIVMMIHDMIYTYEFVVRNNVRNGDAAITWSDVVKKTIVVRNAQNFLRYSGFSAEEVNTIKEYLIATGGEYYKTNDQ